MIDKNLQNLEQRLQRVEDTQAIYELIATHPPSADSGAWAYTQSVYLEDGIFDRGPTLDGASGSADVAAFIDRPEHHQAIAGGLAHVAGLPLVRIEGDTATATSYLLIVHLDHDGPPRVLPNHGASLGYRIHRAVVNRWELERQAGRWRIRRRTLLPVDGSDAHQQLLGQAISDMGHTPARRGDRPDKK